MRSIIEASVAPEAYERIRKHLDAKAERVAGGLDAPVALNAPWEDEEDANFSTYMKGKVYPKLHPIVGQALLDRYFRQKIAKPDVAFFSAIAGDYDCVRFHEALLPQADYLLFSDSRNTVDPYALQELPQFDTDPTRVARFVKTHPQFCLPDYKVGIWIDGNIMVRQDISDELDRFRASGLPVGAIRHPFRQDVFEEAEACIARSKDAEGPIRLQMQRYRDGGIAPDFLIESGLMFFNLTHPALAQIMRNWWGEICRGSRRDQLSFPYALTKEGFDLFDITPPGVSVRNSRKFLLVDHRATDQVPGHRAARTSLVERHYRAAGEAAADAKIDVVVCVHNAIESVTACLESLLRSWNDQCGRLVIVDDGSQSETSDYLKQAAEMFDDCIIVRHNLAQGYTRAANAGLKAGTSEFAILLNSDTIVPGNWAEKILRIFRVNDDIMVVGPMSNAASHQSLPDHVSKGGNTAINELPEGFDVDAMNRWCEENAREHLTFVPLVHGFCFALRRTILSQLGYFDDINFPRGFGEENDFCFRVQNAGYLLAVALDTFVFHEKSQSYPSEERIRLMKAGGAALREIHSKERVAGAVQSMKDNPDFLRLRKLSSRLHFG